MEELRFEVTKYGQITIAYAIYAEIKDRGWKLKLYLDIDTGDVIYPVSIKKLMPGITIELDNEDYASCSLPPSIPETMVDSVRDNLGSVHEVIAAARRLVKEEQEKFKENNI